MAREDKLVERITYLTKIALGEEPNKDFSEAILQAAIKAAKVGYSFAVDKACEWLREELDKEEELHYIHIHGFDKEHREIFLEDFRKAMKGGEKLDADKVIEWLKPYSVIEDNIINEFKKDFGL